MLVRSLVRNDIPALIALAETFLNEDPAFSIFPFDPTIMQLTFLRYLDDEHICVFVAEIDGKLVGFFIGAVSGLEYSATCVASDRYFYVLPEYRGSGAGDGLLDAFERWADSHNVVTKTCQVRSQINVDAAVSYLGRNGYKPFGTVMIKV